MVFRLNCGDIEENPGVLDQCYSNSNYVTTAVLGVRNYVFLETRLREFNRIAVWFKMKTLSD